MQIGVSGCPMRVDTGGAQHLSAGGLAGSPATIRPASGKTTTTAEIVEPAAGPAESRPNGGGAKIHRRAAPPPAGDPAGQGDGATTLPRRPIKHGTNYAYVRHKCRCDTCREAEVQRQREFRARHKQGLVKHRKGGVCVPVRLGDVDYPSISAAAAALGVTAPTLSHRLQKYGCLDLAGQGSRPPRRQALNSILPITIHGREFPSRVAAARYLGVCSSYLSRCAKAGFTATYSDYLLRRLMEADARQAARKVAA